MSRNLYVICYETQKMPIPEDSRRMAQVMDALNKRLNSLLTQHRGREIIACEVVAVPDWAVNEDWKEGNPPAKEVVLRATFGFAAEDASTPEGFVCLLQCTSIPGTLIEV